MKDTNLVYLWPQTPFPAGAALWPKMVGHLTGYGESHYQLHPDYFCPHIIRRGRGTFRNRCGEWPLAAGDMFTLWPGEAVEYFEDPAAPWEYDWIHLHGEGAAAYVAACGFSAVAPCLQARDPQAVMAGFTAVLEAFKQQTPEDACRVVASLYGMVPACAPQPAAGAAGNPDTSHAELVSRVTAMLDTLLHTSVNVNGMATMFKVSRVTLFRAFRECLGVGPMDYLAQARLRRAGELLQHTDQPLAAVARAAGFRNVKYFLRCFRRGTGMTPTVYRRGGGHLH